MNSWEVLGISPTQDKKAIKKAYAKLLAKYHPEEHPEKFEEINQAYNAALNYSNYASLYVEDTHEDYEDYEENERHGEYGKKDVVGVKDAGLYQHFEANSDGSIFHTDTEFEKFIKQEQEQMRAVLDRFSYLLGMKDKTITDSGKKRKAELLDLIRHQFEPLKDNPTFTQGLTSSFYRGENLNNIHIKAIKKVFGIKGKVLPVVYDRELDNAIYQLNRTLESLPTTGGNPMVNWIAIIIIAFVILSSQTGRFDPSTQQTAEPSLARPETLYYLGNAYRLGNRGEQSEVNALARILQTDPSPSQIHEMGLIYFHGRNVEQSDERAVYFYRKAAEQGYARGQLNMGWMYTHGRGVIQCHEQAVYWYRKAAEQGYITGKLNMGIMYEQGRGVPQSYEQAAYWYRKAAEEDHIYAQNNLGLLYRDGRGVEQSYEQTVYWLRRSADLGSIYAQANLGQMYERGRGVPQNLEQAEYWYQKSAEGGNPWAEDALSQLLARHE